VASRPALFSRMKRGWPSGEGRVLGLSVVKSSDDLEDLVEFSDVSGGKPSTLRDWTCYIRRSVVSNRGTEQDIPGQAAKTFHPQASRTPGRTSRTYSIRTKAPLSASALASTRACRNVQPSSYIQRIERGESAASPLMFQLPV
jgi:hypothetical protein